LIYALKKFLDKNNNFKIVKLIIFAKMVILFITNNLLVIFYNSGLLKDLCSSEYLKKSIMIKKKIKLKDNIAFGIFFFIFFLIIGFYPLRSVGVIRIWSVVLSLVFLIITIIRPNLFTFLNKFWIQFGISLGKIISPVILGLVFFFVITPTGILVKIIKKDVMGLKREASSYWINRKDKQQSMKKQF